MWLIWVANRCSHGYRCLWFWLSGLMTLLSLHLSSAASFPLSVLHTNFYFKWVLCLFKCDNIKACHQPLEMPVQMDVDTFRTQIERVLEGCVFVCLLNWSNPAGITSASQLKWHLRNVYDYFYFSFLLCSFEFVKIVMLRLVILSHTIYDIRI